MKSLGVALSIIVGLFAVLAYDEDRQVDPCVKRDELHNEYSRLLTRLELRQKYESFDEYIAALEKGEMGFFEDEMPEPVRRQYRTAVYECERNV